jgi:hypothetical protein
MKPYGNDIRHCEEGRETARISVRNLAFSRDFTCPDPSSGHLLPTMLFETASLIFFVKPTMTKYDEALPLVTIQKFEN